MDVEQRVGDAERRDAKRLVGAHTRLNQALGEMLELVAELDTDEALHANAMTDVVSWLHFDLGIARKTARAWVRAGRALADLPIVEAAFRRGAISLDEVLILCRFATPENEFELTQLTREFPVDELAAAIRNLLDVETPVRSERPSPLMSMWWNESVLQLRGSIPGADGVLVETAILRLAARAPLSPDDGLFRDPDERSGEALVQMASESVAGDRDHDRATVVVHVGLDDLADPAATVMVGGKVIERDELLRLTCDGRVQTAVDDPDGLTVGIGRVSRQIPSWLRRVMSDRDGGCRFPGCARVRWTHAHHLQHWANGGPTNLDNLVTLCGFHHRLIHRQGWVVDGNPNRELRFINQWGRLHESARLKISSDHQARLVDDLGYYAEHRLRLVAATAPT